jgi:two-component system catabolic regulation response regulator CreB
MESPVLKVLLVEDEISIADNVRVALHQEGYLLDHAKTGAEGLRLIGSQAYDVLIFDIGLPDQTGFELCKKVRMTVQTPLLFLTARGDEIDKIVGFELGADDYLTKPFSPRELAMRVRALAKRAQTNRMSTDAKLAESGRVSQRGLFKVDHEKMKIHFDGVPLELSRYEFRLMELMIRRPGVVFSRQQLMEAVWEDPGMSLERTVDAHIKSLRAKLKAVKPTHSPIETHRGTGYSLKES